MPALLPTYSNSEEALTLEKKGPLSEKANIFFFHLFTTVNNAAMNTGVQVSPGDPFSVLLATYEEVELLDHMVTIFSFFEEMLYYCP